MALFFWDVNGDEPVFASGLLNGHLGSAVDLNDLAGYDTADMPLPNRVKAYVPDYGIYLFDSGSSVPPNPPNIIQPTTGPGRWFLRIREGEFEALGIEVSAFDGILSSAENVQQALNILDDINASQVEIATPFDGHLAGDTTIQQALDTIDNLDINRLIVDGSSRQSITFTAGTDISLLKTGSGTTASPYNITITNTSGGGGSGAVTQIVAGTGIDVNPSGGTGIVEINVTSDVGNVNVKQNGAIIESPAPSFGQSTNPATDPVFVPVTKGVSSGEIGTIPAKQTLDVCSESTIVARSIAIVDSLGNNQAVNYQLSATVSGETTFDPAKVIINPTSGKITVSQGTSGGGGGISGINITDFSDSPPTTYTDRTAINFDGFNITSTGPSNVLVSQPFVTHKQTINLSSIGNLGPMTSIAYGSSLSTLFPKSIWKPIGIVIDRSWFLNMAPSSKVMFDASLYISFVDINPNGNYEIALVIFNSDLQSINMTNKFIDVYVTFSNKTGL